jgi:hypothetical protein
VAGGAALSLPRDGSSNLVCAGRARLDARGAAAGLANGIDVRLGRRQIDERLDRFIQTALPVMSGRAAEIDYVDMRYSNGFAIGWRRPRGLASRGGVSKDAPTASSVRTKA